MKHERVCTAVDGRSRGGAAGEVNGTVEGGRRGR